MNITNNSNDELKDIVSSSGNIKGSKIYEFIIEHCVVINNTLSVKRSLVRILHQHLLDKFLEYCGLTKVSISSIEFRKLLQRIIEIKHYPVTYRKAEKGMCWEGIMFKKDFMNIDSAVRNKDSTEENTKHRKCLEMKIRFMVDTEIVAKSAITHDDLILIKRERLKKVIWKVEEWNLPWKIPELDMLREHQKSTTDLVSIYVDIDRTIAETAVRWRLYRDAKDRMDEKDLNLYKERHLTERSAISARAVEEYMNVMRAERDEDDRREKVRRNILLREVLIHLNIEDDNLIIQVRKIINKNRLWMKNISGGIIDESKLIADYVKIHMQPILEIRKVPIKSAIGTLVTPVREQRNPLVYPAKKIPTKPIQTIKLRFVSSNVDISKPVVNIRPKSKALIEVTQPINHVEVWTADSELELQDMLRDKESGDWNDSCQEELDIMLDMKERLS